MATFGMMLGEKKERFSLVARLEMTAPASVSLPVAAMVGMAQIGSASETGMRFIIICQASISVQEAAAMTFEQSMTLPPPTAKIMSMLCCLHILTPS